MKVKIPNCPRCGGFLYWPITFVKITKDIEYYKDKLKCYNCSRTFILIPIHSNNGTKRYKLVQFPERNEHINTVFVEIPKEEKYD